jgi:hypothetical protein
VVPRSSVGEMSAVLPLPPGDPEARVESPRKARFSMSSGEVKAPLGATRKRWSWTSTLPASTTRFCTESVRPSACMVMPSSASCAWATSTKTRFSRTPQRSTRATPSTTASSLRISLA